MINTIKEWVNKRFKEPSSWAAVGVGAISLGLLFNSWASVLALLAIAAGVSAIILKEKGTS
tara:strand:- start:298 stop:480 length:183 start_codon:yes stop_codon:yes gene_type:complete